jgi:hypothetical protein
MPHEKIFRWYKWLPLIFGIVGGIVGWHKIDSVESVVLRLISGSAVGAGIGFIGLVNSSAHRYLIAGVAVLLLFASAAVVAIASQRGTIGTIILAGAVAGAMFWALTRPPK